MLIRFGYDGQRFHGVQPQPGLHTAGAALLQRIAAAGGAAPFAVSFAARTDAGVHALANVASCRVRGTLPATWQEQLAAPRDDGLVDVTGIIWPRRTMARALATGKVYRYCIATDEPAARAWPLGAPLDVSAMQRAAEDLVGTHDFSAFAAPGCAAKNPCKTLTSARLWHADGCVWVEVAGTAFLRKMVRIIVGTLVEIGRGERAAASIHDALQSGRRAMAAGAAPARGLTLVSVTISA